MFADAALSFFSSSQGQDRPAAIRLSDQLPSHEDALTDSPGPVLNPFGPQPISWVYNCGKRKTHRKHSQILYYTSLPEGLRHRKLPLILIPLPLFLFPQSPPPPNLRRPSFLFPLSTQVRTHLTIVEAFCPGASDAPPRNPPNAKKETVFFLLKRLIWIFPISKLLSFFQLLRSIFSSCVLPFQIPHFSSICMIFVSR